MSQELLQVVSEKVVLRHQEGSWPNIKNLTENDGNHLNNKTTTTSASYPDKKGRRKSWHAIKFERKRRKELLDDQFGLPPQIRREKKGSWWNIFANPPRSRRASQDITKVPKEFPWIRSKSRSVDHGVSSSSSPYDLSILQNQVPLDNKVAQLNMNFVDDYFNQSQPSSCAFLDKKTEHDGSASSLTERKKLGPPENTTTYIVADRDTLTSVAARFDTTPSELTKLNRLGTPYIFPGQQLYVPIREHEENDSEGSTPIEDNQDDLPPEEKELLDNLRPVSPKPGHVERVRTPSCSQGVSTDNEEDFISVFRERFLKINVRHITDGEGVVSGVLLVTPNAVMFDPHVSDTLVIEKGSEAYGVIAPMEFVVNIAIYNDIAHMRVGHMETTSTTTATTNGNEKAEIYYPKGEKEQYSYLVKDETFPELVTGTDDAESVCSCTEREGDAFPKAFERDLVTPTNLDNHENEQEHEQQQQQKTADERRKSLLDHHWPMTSRERQSIDVDEMPNMNLHDHLEEDDDQQTNEVKESCHDSGIDIRETPQVAVAPIPVKEHYSDAEIVLSKDWVPPVTIAPATNVTNSETESPRKKNSVSFSLDSNDADTTTATQLTTSLIDSKDDYDKFESRKNKMLKRLSYPLSWIEKEDEKTTSSQPQSADSQHSSVFSKVFSSSPIHLVDFGAGLFTKTPSEDSGGSGGPHSAGSIGGGAPLTGESVSSSSTTSSTSFFPTNIISSVGASVGAMGAQVGAQVGAMGAQVGAQVGALGSTVGSTVGAVSAQVGATVGSTVSAAVGRSSVGTFIRQPTESGSKKNPPKLDYKSMVSLEDKPDLFVSVDIRSPHYGLNSFELIPRPARSCEDPPLYLRLKMGKPLNKKIPHSTPLMSYGKKKMRPEYWFSIPKNRVDQLYRFIQAWVPQLYGELDEEKVKERGFILVDMDTELWSEEPTPSASRHGSQGEELSELTKESWELIKAPYAKLYNIIKTQTLSEGSVDEVISMSDEYRKAYKSSKETPSLDIDIPPPELIGTTEILSDEHREALCQHLPARAYGYAWSLVFSTSQHGFSLNSMYRKMYRLESPILLVIEDTDNNVFGAFISCALRVSEHFYGTGESLLFRFTPVFQVFNWTGQNIFFVKGNNESLSIGAGDGKFGLWLDGDLYIGRTEACQTFGNEPLTPKNDFVVKTLECWAFISS